MQDAKAETPRERKDAAAETPRQRKTHIQIFRTVFYATLFARI
jgi:hypothetical protein